MASSKHTLTGEVRPASSKQFLRGEVRPTSSSQFLRGDGESRGLLFCLDFDAYPPSVANLPAAMTINGTTVLPTFRYKGGDAGASTWAPWGYGETLTLQAGTAPSYNQGSPLLGSTATDDSVKLNAGGYYTGSVGSPAVGTKDFVLEFMSEAAASGTHFATLKNGASLGWAINGTNAFNIYCTDGTNVTTGSSATLAAGAIYLAHLFVDRSGSAQWYVNGVASGAAITWNSTLTITSDAAFQINGFGGTNQPITAREFYIAMWQGASWLDTHLQATVAATRFAQLTGTYPLRAAGTALPTALTRSTTGYLDKVEADGTTKLYLMGANWPRCCSRLDSAGVLRKGLLVESAGTNEVGNSQSLSGWTASYGDLSLVGTSPTGDSSVIRFLESADTNVHWTYRAGTTAGRRISMFARANGRSWLRLISYDDSAYRSSYFNVSTGAIGTVSSYHSGAAITSIPGWGYRVSVKITAGNDYFYWGPADSDGGSTYAGDVTKGIDVWQIQVENGAAHPSSAILTPSSSPVTRTADVPPYYVANDGNVTAGRGACEVGFLGPNVAMNAGNTLAIISDGATKLIQILYATTDAARLAVYNPASQADVIGTTDIFDGAHHRVRATWNTNLAQLLTDGVVQGTTDTSCAMPTGLTQIHVGGYISAGYECNGLITRLAVYDR